MSETLIQENQFGNESIHRKMEYRLYQIQANTL